MEANNRRERIEGKDFVEGGVYEVYDKKNDELPLGIYFYPTSYPAIMEFERNSRGTLSKFFNEISEPLKLRILYSRIYHREKGKYAKFDKSKIYGKKPVSIIKSESYYSKKIDLSNLDLSYAKLRDSHLVRVHLSNTNLSHANLTGADLTGTKLTGSNLTGAKLGKTILNGIKSSQIIGSPDTLPKGYYLVEGCIIGPDTKISNSLGNKYKQIEIKNGNITKQYLLGPNVDLTGVDLSQIEQFALNDSNLTGANLSRAKLTGVYLRDVNLTRANLTDADLTGVHLSNVNLTRADLTGVDLSNAHFNDSVILTGIKSSLIKGIPQTLPKGYYLVDGIIIGPDIDIPSNTLKGFKLKRKYKKIKIKNKNVNKEYIIGPNVDLTRVNLTGIDLTGIDLTGAILTNAILTNAILTGANLTGAKLTDATFYRSNLNGANLTGANLTYANLTGADLTHAILTDVNLTRTNLSGADLTGAVLTDVNLTGIISGHIKGNPRLPNEYKLINGYIIGPNVNLYRADLTEIDLTDAILTRVYLTSAKLNDAVLTNANLTGADLTGAILYHADLTGAKLNDAVLTNSNLTGAVLTYANLTGAVLTDVKLTGIISGHIKGNPRLPNKYKLINGYIIGPYVNLTDADLTDVDLTDVDLTAIDLTGIKLCKIKGNPKLPNGYILINGYIIGPNMDLSGANLTGVNLSSVKLGRIKGNPKLPDGYKLINGYIIGPNMDLTNVDLTGANLTGVNLTGIISGGIKGTPKLPKGYILIDGYIFGPNVNLAFVKFDEIIDLTYVNLSGANLSNIQLSHGCLLSYSNLNKCDLTGAKLSGVDLTGANLEQANLNDAKLSENSLSEKQKSQIIGQPIYVHTKISDTINISKRIFEGKNEINQNVMNSAIYYVEKKIEEEIKESIKRSFIEKEQREPRQEELTEIYKKTISKNSIKGNKNVIHEEYNKRLEKKIKQEEEDIKNSIKESFKKNEGKEPTQNEINRIYENTISKNTKKNKNFSDLLDYLLDKKNQGRILKHFRFSLFKQAVSNAGGLTQSIFEKCYKIFIKRYFIEYNFGGNYYVILKDLNEKLFEEFKKACEFMILLAKKKNGNVKILIKINPDLLKLLELGNGNRNNSNNQFSLKRIQRQERNENGNNSNNQFSLKRIERQRRNEINESLILENSRIFNAKHFDKVEEFYRLFWKINPNIFTNHIDYSWDNFKERLRFKLPNSELYISFDKFMTQENAQINAYPFIKLILDYLQESDEYRMRFTTLVCGTYTYTGPIYIIIHNRNKDEIISSLFPHTCFQTIDVFIDLNEKNLYSDELCENANANVSGRENVRGNSNVSGRENVRGNSNVSGRENGNGNGNGRERGRGRNGNGNGNSVPRVNNSPNKKCKFSIIKLNEKIEDLLERYTKA